MISKKSLIKLPIFLLFSLKLFCAENFSSPSQNLKQYTLENGLEIYMLEDYSDALVHIDFSCKAGFSYQNQDDMGFFKLYSRLIPKIFNEHDFSDIQCNADSSRYKITATYSQLENLSDSLSKVFFNPQFSDDVISEGLNELKNEVTATAQEMSTFINASIDSKVFSDAPWKNDSGVYPPLFKRTTEQTARNKIKYISENYYIPKNCAIFIWGNINSEKLLVTLKNTFGRYYSTAPSPTIKKGNLVNKNRKYVLHDSEISSDLTQVVIQYTLLDMQQCNLLAATLNNDYSLFKEKLLNIPELNIPGAEYINVASVSKGGNSRLIIQTLIQKPEDKKSKITSKEQAELFLEKVMEAAQETPVYDFSLAKEMMKYEFQQTLDNQSSFMETLSQFWAIEKLQKNSNYEQNSSHELSAALDSTFLEIDDTNIAQTKAAFESETPFVFVIINSKDFKSNKKSYTSAGFEEINQTNSSWYVQEMYKEIKNQFAVESQKTPGSYISLGENNDNGFYEKNINQIKTFVLENGINVYTKQNYNSRDCSLMLVISGGKLASADDNGFEEVMINILSSMIQRALNSYYSMGLFTQIPDVSSKTELTQSYIMINYSKEDEVFLCDALYTTLVYGELLPAMADRAVSSRQYKKRLENGSAVNQLFAGAVKEIYGNGSFYNIYETKNDILTKTDYTKILEAYPALLDSKRYSIILCGNFSEQINKELNKTLGQIPAGIHPAKTEENFECKIPSGKTINMKIEHTFLTDIPAEEAGPMPAVLIPTTEFLDPVIYIQKAPEEGTKEAAIYSAMAEFICKEFNEAAVENKKIQEATASADLPENKMPFCRITIQNVAHTKEADSAYKTTVKKIKAELENGSTSSKTIQKIKDTWTEYRMQGTSENAGTARLMEQSLRKTSELQKNENAVETAGYYLKEYNYIQTATAEDFLNILQYFPETPSYRIYSSDSKK